MANPQPDAYTRVGGQPVYAGRKGKLDGAAAGAGAATGALNAQSGLAGAAAGAGGATGQLSTPAALAGAAAASGSAAGLLEGGSSENYRSTNRTLFADAAAWSPTERISGIMSIAARPSVADPKDPYEIAIFGPHRSYVDKRSEWAWVNTGGDWVNTAVAAQSTSSPHASFTANAVTSGSAAYSGIDITAGVQAAFRRGKWNAYIVRATASSRSLATHNHATLPAPSISVTYSDGTTATLACVACVALPLGTAYTQVGDGESQVSSAIPGGTTAIEFEMPTKRVTAATLNVTLSQHTATPASVQLFLATPPQNTRALRRGISEDYPLDNGITANGAVLFAQRFQDGSTLSDWVHTGITSINVNNIANWDMSLYGGAADTTKLPTAYLGTSIAGSNKWFHKQALAANLSLVNSAYTGEGFKPFAPGIGALRIIMPGSAAADGANVGSPGSTGSDLWYLFPKAISGLLSEGYVRFAVRFAWARKAVTDTKMYRNAVGSAARYTIPTGKWGVGFHHWTNYGGNNRVGGDNLGWTNRLGYEEVPADVPVGGLRPFVHSLDMNPYDTGQVDMQMGVDGGLGSAFYPDRWYEVEVRMKLNTYDAQGAIGTSPQDGVMEVWVDGRLTATHTGWRYRDGAIDYATTPQTALAPFREMGAMGLALNTYNGGVTPPDRDLVMFVGPTVAATSYIGPMRRATPAWQPAAGSAASIGYTSGTHPSGLPATIADLDPNAQSWNPTPGNPPWSAGTWWWTTTAGSYGGGCFSETQRKWICSGHGHAAVCVPVPTAFDLEKLAWEWLDIPPPSNGLASVNSYETDATTIAAAYPADQFDTTWCDWLGDYSGWGAYKRPGRVFPEMGHTYQLEVWVPGWAAGNVNGLYMNLSGPSGNKNTTALFPGRHVFDLDTNKWVRNANGMSQLTGFAGGACFHSGAKKVFVLSKMTGESFQATVEVFDPLTRTWAQTTATAAVPLAGEDGGLRDHPPSGLLLHFTGSNAGGANTYVDGVKHRIYAVDGVAAAAGSHTWQELTVNLSAPTWPLGVVSDYGAGVIATIGWAYCPVNGCFYAINGADGSTDLWKLSPPVGASSQAQYLSGTWTVTKETLSTPIVSKAFSNGASTGAKFVYNRLQWDQQSRSFIFVPNHQYGRPQSIRPSGV